MAERDDGSGDREPVADTLPDARRAELEQMRALAQPYLDRITAELEANPTTLLHRLPAFREATSTDDEQLQDALLAAVLERHIDSGDDLSRELVLSFQRWEGDQPVIGLLQREWAARAFEDMAARREEIEERQAAAAASWPRPLPAHLEERRHRHRLVAAPWLERVERRDEIGRRVQEAWLRSDDLSHENRVRMWAEAGWESKDDLVGDMKEQPGDVQVSIALTWLYESLRDVSSSNMYSSLGVWNDLNRRALPYEADDLELGLGLLEGHQYNWIYGKELVRAIERHSKKAGGTPEQWHDSLRAILAASAGSRRAEYQKMAVRIRSLLGSGDDPAAEAAPRLDVSSIDGPDAWSTTVRERLTERHGDDGGLNALLALLQDSGTAPRPSAVWQRKLAPALAASDAAPAVVRLLLETAIEVRDDLVGRTDAGNWLYSTLGQPAALQIRAAAWTCQLSGVEWAPDLLERLAAHYAELLFAGEPHSGRVVNGAVSALALRAERDSVVRLARLQRAMWHGGLRKHIDRELESLAADAGLTRGQLLELSAPDLGLDDDGRATLPVGSAGSLTLSLDDRCRLVTDWSAPLSELRSSEPERVTELQQHVKQTRASLAVERDRIDGLLAEQPRWSAHDWAASYEQHPVLRAFGRTLVWNVDLGDEIRAGLPGTGAGTFIDLGGAPFAADDEATIMLWHPIVSSDVAEWRSALFERRLVQPVRQVFREVYRLVPDERGPRHYSTRFAGRLVKHQPLRGLLKRRGWKAPGLFVWDAGGPDVAVASRVFPGFGIRAELRYRPEWTEEALDGVPGSYDLVSTDQLRFHPEGKKGADALALEDVPALVVSEAMRDVDLFVSVCSIALDPAWRDVGDDELRQQWREHAFGELVESARIRRDLLERALPELSIADRCSVYERDLVVSGTRATYRIHLGSGQVRVDPDGTPLVVPEKRVGGRELASLFLPVEPDDTLAAVLSTSFLLANDDAITDPALLEQLP